ncbi:hypothetical protein MMC30_005863 [Trapelia coarctata]|nr:hypothetical protein [Trapelia coarctata]
MPTSKVYTSLLSAARAITTAFASHFPSLSHFSSTPTALEHGHPSLAPFLGRSFRGPEGLAEYFSLLEKYLTYENMRFEDFVVDEMEKVVSVKGMARFVWKETGVGWEECFTYRLGMVEEEGGWKVHVYEVWADSGAL